MASSYLRICLVNLYSILFTILFFLVFLLSLVIFTPIYLFRFLTAFVLRPLFRPDLGKLVNTRSAVIAGTDNPTKSPNWILCVWLVLEGQLDFPQFQRNFYENIILRRVSPGGKLHSPEYQQYFTQWLGFTFWKWETHFNVAEHMRYLFPEENQNFRGKVTNSEDLRKVIKRLSYEPFPVGKSPWEFLFLPHYQDDTKSGSDKSVLIFRVHHGFCDGFAILNLLMKEVNGVSLQNVAKPDENFLQNRKSKVVRLLQTAGFWLSGPFLSMKMVVRAVDRNEWHLPESRLTKPYNVGFTPRIKLDYIKDIKNLHGVSFSAVIYSSLAGALGKMMRRMGKRVPERMSTAVAVPMPGHPYKLRNHFIFSFLQLPTGIEDPIQRLNKMERNVKRLKDSPAPVLNFGLVPLVGGTFTKLMKLFSPNSYSSVLTSNFPGPPGSIMFIGGGGSHRIVDMNFAAGLGEGNVGIGFCMMSYDQGMRIISSFDKSILPTDELVDLFNELVFQEMKMLRCSPNANSV